MTATPPPIEKARVCEYDGRFYMASPTEGLREIEWSEDPPKSKEKLIVTMELDDVPEGFGLEFYVRQAEDFWFTRFKPFRNWKRITMHPIRVTKLDVQKP